MLRPDEIKTEAAASFSGCDVCGEQHETTNCPQLQHGKQVENARAPSRARLTLPSNLRIKKLKEGAFTIVVRENIGCGTRFGPFEAQVVYDLAPQSRFPLRIFEKNGGSYFLDSSNEEECNWMFFVLPAQTQSEQNLMAYQLNQDIYFGALRDIRIHEELKVWYAPHYAKKMAVVPPWPPETDETESLKSRAPTPEKTVPKIPVEEKSQEPAKKRGRKKKIYADFVETPDLDDLDDVSQEFASTEETQNASVSKDPAVGADQPDWRCSQCGRQFQSRVDFARHLREHYDPRKSGETNGKQKRGLQQMRPKKFGCAFCEAKFSSSKRLQRHRLRLHRRQLRRKKSPDAAAATTTENSLNSVIQTPVGEETVAEEVEIKSRHISDTDAASILLEIEANVDKPEEGLVENCGEDAEPEPSFGTDIEYLDTGIGDIKDAGLEEDASADDPIAADALLDEVADKTGLALDVETMYSQSDSVHDPKGASVFFSCDICSSTFNKSEDLYKHIGIHMGNFPCTTCGKGFARKESLSKHVCSGATSADAGNNSDEDSNAEHFCPFCQKFFAKYQLLRRHISKHTGEFTCQDCGKSYCSRNILRSHVCSKKPEERGNYSCEICHKTFSKESYLEKHIPVHTGAHACPNCGKWLRSNDSLNNHIRVCSQVKELETSGSATCPHCKKVFTDARSFRSHMYDHTHLYMCTNCGARFKNKVSEVQHLCQTERIVKCDICGEKFPSVAALNKHKLSHGEEEQFKCDTCDAAFGQEEELAAHRCTEKTQKKKSKKRSAGQSNLQPLICEVCGSQFSSTSSLNVHKRLHGEKLFSCDICGKQFHRKDLMLDHSAVHGEAAVPCPMCNKMFKTKKSLDVHMLIHDGVKRFACESCGKQFYQKGNLLKHEEVHNPQRKYPCSYCSKSFSTKEYLAIHVVEHTRGRVHVCDACDKSFVKEHQLKAHQRVFHTNLAYICSFCGLSVKLKHSLKRHLNKKHSDQRSQWNSAEQIDAMLVTNGDREDEEEDGNNTESMQLVETVNQVRDGTEVLLAVAGIGSEELQQVLASGTTLIQQRHNVIEISLPAENEMVDDAFLNGVLGEGGDELQTQIIHLPMSNEMESSAGIDETVDVIEQMQVENAAQDEAMETQQITVLSADEPFPHGALTGNETIVLDNGTILQQGISQEDGNVFFYVLTTNEPNCDHSDEAPS